MLCSFSNFHLHFFFWRGGGGKVTDGPSYMKTRAISPFSCADALNYYSWKLCVSYNGIGLLTCDCSPGINDLISIPYSRDGGVQCRLWSGHLPIIWTERAIFAAIIHLFCAVYTRPNDRYIFFNLCFWLETMIQVKISRRKLDACEWSWSSV